MLAMRLTRLLNFVALFLVLLVVAFLVFGGPSAFASTIKVSFKLDPSLTRGMYMGDRWVSRPIFTTTSQPGKMYAIEARVESHDKGVNPIWTPSDPEMVKVEPQQGQRVTITVLRAGQSTVQVTLQRASRTLSIKATYQDNETQVEISQ